MKDTAPKQLLGMAFYDDNSGGVLVARIRLNWKAPLLF